MKLIGIDPGSHATGYGIIELENDNPRIVDKGVIKISSKIDRYQRITMLYHQIADILSEHKPECAAIEDAFYYKNAKTALILGQVKGIIILALQENNCKIYEFSPLEIKRAVVGYGLATKEQVQMMITRLFKIDFTTLSYDCSDAIATALCLSNSIKLLRLTAG